MKPGHSFTIEPMISEGRIFGTHFSEVGMYE